jgi:hypothetical protein
MPLTATPHKEDYQYNPDVNMRNDPDNEAMDDKEALIQQMQVQASQYQKDQLLQAYNQVKDDTPQAIIQQIILTAQL